jgi:O-antigen biosynthesis protein
MRRGYQLLNTSLTIWRTGGSGAFAKSLGRWLRGERRYYHSRRRRWFARPYRTHLGSDVLTIYPAVNTEYQFFIRQFEPSLEDLEQQHAQTWVSPVKFSVVTSDPPATQTYPCWECASLDSASGDWIVLLGSGDVLAPHALYTLACYLREHPDTDVLYSDTDHLDARGRRCNPLFKPDWSPELLLSANICRDLLAFRRELLPLYKESVWEFVLRAAELGKRFAHVPGVLYHRRRPAADEDRRTVVQSHLQRTGLHDVQVKESGVTWSMDWPHVSIIIPSKDQAAVLETCLHSLFALTDYPAFDVTVVDTGSRETATFDLYQRYGADSRFRVVVDREQPFNFSRACNIGAQDARGRAILFLNNDTQVLHADWLRRMVQWFAREGVGIVGCKLLYPNTRTIQHGGVIVGLGGLAAHLFQQQPDDADGIFGSARWYRNFLAVTAACLLIRTEVFRAVGGFEEEFLLNYSDVDLCLKVHTAGWRIVYTPDVTLWHHEGLTHRARIPRRDFEIAAYRWEAVLRAGDPYFNRYLSVHSADPRLIPHPADEAFAVHQTVMNRLPDKVIIQLPDDLL